MLAYTNYSCELEKAKVKAEKSDVADTSTGKNSIQLVG
jgi:hypothetical protein